MNTVEPLCIEQIMEPESLYLWLPRLGQLIHPWLTVLQDDTQAPLRDENILYANLVEQLPYLWITYNRNGEVVAGASLTQVIPHCHAFLHGVRSLRYRKHPALLLLIERIFEEAFSSLGLYKLKAEFEADNRGALGFCRMHGFSKEAHFKEDNLVQGQRKDVVVYSLFYPAYVNNRITHNRRYENPCLSEENVLK